MDTGWLAAGRFLLQAPTDHTSLLSWASKALGLTSEGKDVTQVRVLKDSAKLCSQKAGPIWGPVLVLF